MTKCVSAAALLALASSPAYGFLLYEGFQYDPGNLTTTSPTYTGVVNPFGPQWAAAGTADNIDNIQVIAPGLTAPGSLGGAGNSIDWGGTGNASRIEVGPFINTGDGRVTTLYYSLMLRISDYAALPLATGGQGNIIAGFNTVRGPQTNAPSIVPGSLRARQHPDGDPTHYQIGLGKNNVTASHMVWDPNPYTIGQAYFIVGNYVMNPEITPFGGTPSVDDVANAWISPDLSTFGALTAPTPTLTATLGNDVSTNRIESFAIRQSGPAAAMSGYNLDELRIDTTWAGVAPAAPASWAGGDGNWSAPGNWSTAAAPNAAGANTSFGTSAAPTTITVDSAHTVGTLNFASSSAYSIVGSSTLTVNGSSSINVYAGQHTISAPVTVETDLNVTVATGAGLTVSQMNVNPNLRLVKSGYGDLTVNTIKTQSLLVHGGRLTIAPNGTSAGTVVVNEFSMPTWTDFNRPAEGAFPLTQSGKLDMTDNDIIVNYAASAASPEFMLRDLVLSARDGETDGIFFTGSDDENSDKILAFGEAAELAVTSYDGFTVDDSTIIGKYTYYGDANFDGQVTTDDYVAVDLGLGTGNSWVQGDFDLNGVVTTDDYVVVDLNLGKGTSDPLAWAEEQARMIALHTEMFGESYVDKLAYAREHGWIAASVPEPAALSVVGFGAIGLLGRRRRGGA